MSATRAVVVANVRSLIDDENPSRYAISSSRMNRIIEMEMQRAAQMVGLGPSWSTGAVTLVAGTATYTVSSEIGRILDVRLSYQNRVLGKLAPSQMTALKQGPNENQGYPAYYSLYEDSSQTLQVTVDPVPTSAEIGSGLTLDLFIDAIPTALATDASTIPFSVPLLRDLEKMSAAHCVHIMSADELANRKLDRGASELWAAQANAGYIEEKMRLKRHRLVSHISLSGGRL